MNRTWRSKAVRRALLLWMGCFAHALADEPAALSDDQLAAKAERLQRVVEEKVLQQHGMIPMLVRASDYALPTAEDYVGAYRHRHLHGKSEAEVGIPPMHVWRAWENTASNTGYYLRAATFQYRVTGNPEVLKICQRTFGALRYIAELSVPHGERGLLCKPYGGVYSNQTSNDQLQCVVWGLDAYRKVAPPEDVVSIDEMSGDFARYRIKTGYAAPHGYFGRGADEIREPWQEMKWQRSVIVLPSLYLAWYGTGDTVFTDEIDRLRVLSGKGASLAVATDRFKTGGYGGRRNIYLPAQMMEMDPAHHKIWRESMVTNYRQGKTGLLPDGTWPTHWTYDSQRGGMQPIAADMPLGRTGRSALYAMGCVSAQRWCPEEGMKDTARAVLAQLDEDTFRFILPLDDAHPLPTEWQVEAEMLDCDCLTAWLCGYWEGRFHGYW